MEGGEGKGAGRGAEPVPTLPAFKPPFGAAYTLNAHPLHTHAYTLSSLNCIATHASPQERHEILRASLRPAPPEGVPVGAPCSALRGRVVAMLPGERVLPPPPPLPPLPAADAAGASTSAAAAVQAAALPPPAADDVSVMSRAGTTRDLIKEMFDRNLARGEEGLVIKPLDSTYNFDERKTWIKVPGSFPGWGWVFVCAC